MKVVRPTSIRIDASSACQLKCPLCPIHSGQVPAVIGSGFLRLADFQRLLQDNPRLTRVELANYGEIFLNPELLEILRCAFEHGVALKASDGANLNTVKEEVLEGLVKYRFESLTCSIDGATDETYQKYRVRGSLPTVLANIRAINNYKERYRSTLPRLRWQFIAFGHNEHELDLAKHMAAELNMEFRLKLNWDPAFSPVTDDEMLRKERGAATREEYRRRFGEDYDAANCIRLWTEPQINWDGTVLGCTRNFWGEFGGNAFSDGLEAAVNTERIRYAREMLLGRRPAREDVPCATCSLYLDRRAEGKWLPRNRVEPSPAYRAARFAYRTVRP